MGIEGLTKLLKDKAPSSIEEITLEHLRGTRVAVDVSSYLHQYAYNSDNKGKGSYIRGFFEMIVVLAKFDILPIFVFDGKASDAKADTISKRQDAKQTKYDKIVDLTAELANVIGADASDTHKVGFEKALSTTKKELTKDDYTKITALQQEIAHHEKNIIVITDNMFTELVELFTLCGVPYFKARGEADFMCVKLCKAGIASAVLSEDMDILTHGAPMLVRGINDNDFRKNGKLRCHHLDRILASFGMSQQEFIDTCIMCTCDYATSPPGVGPKTAYTLIAKHRSIDAFVEQCEEGKLKYDVSGFTYERAREEFKKSDLETVPLTSDIVQKPRKPEAIVKFITIYSNYTLKTAQKKLEELSGKAVAPQPAKPKIVAPIAPVPVKVGAEVKAKPKITIVPSQIRPSIPGHGNLATKITINIGKK